MHVIPHHYRSRELVSHEISLGVKKTRWGNIHHAIAFIYAIISLYEFGLFTHTHIGLFLKAHLGHDSLLALHMLS